VSEYLSEDSMERLRRRWANEELEAERNLKDPHPFAAVEVTVFRGAAPDLYVCNKCGYAGPLQKHPGCRYFAAYAPPLAAAIARDWDEMVGA
jgi:hypothetical protein